VQPGPNNSRPIPSDRSPGGTEPEHSFPLQQRIENTIICYDPDRAGLRTVLPIQYCQQRGRVQDQDRHRASRNIHLNVLRNRHTERVGKRSDRSLKQLAEDAASAGNGIRRIWAAVVASDRTVASGLASSCHHHSPLLRVGPDSTARTADTMSASSPGLTTLHTQPSDSLSDASWKASRVFARFVIP
jgi:hypothetical protein